MEQLSVINAFQDEYHRILSPMEKQIIDDWLTKYSGDTIIKCLKEGVFNGVTTFRYINKILESSATEEPVKKEDGEKDLSWLD